MSIIFPRIRAIVYDIDNCLAETHTAILSVWHEAFAAEFNIPLEEAILQQGKYFNTYGCGATGFAANFDRPREWVNSFYDRTAKACGERFRKTHVPDGQLAKLVQEIHELGIIQLVCTQGHPDHYAHVLEHLEIDTFIPQHHRVDRLVVPESKKTDVPHKHVLGILAQLGIAPHQALLFEDSPANLWPFIRLGGHGVLINGHSQSSVKKHQAPLLLGQYPTIEEPLSQLIRHLTASS